MNKIWMLSGFLLLLPRWACADISDTGDLILGGQAIVGGTMTVSGNAFSVGATTLSVSEGVVSVGGLLKPSASGIEWADGTTSTTAASPGGGSNVVIPAGGFLEYGEASQPNPLNVGQFAVWAKSVDSISTSSGCLVVVRASGSGAGAQIVATSTTSINTYANLNGVPGIMLEGTCAPGASCRVGLYGIYRVQADASGISTGNTESFSATKCRTHTNGLDDANTTAYAISPFSTTPPTGIPPNAWHWVRLK